MKSSEKSLDQNHPNDRVGFFETLSPGEISEPDPILSSLTANQSEPLVAVSKQSNASSCSYQPFSQMTSKYYPLPFSSVKGSFQSSSPSAVTVTEKISNAGCSSHPSVFHAVKDSVDHSSLIKDIELSVYRWYQVLCSEEDMPQPISYKMLLAKARESHSINVGSHLVPFDEEMWLARIKSMIDLVSILVTFILLCVFVSFIVFLCCILCDILISLLDLVGMLYPKLN